MNRFRSESIALDRARQWFHAALRFSPLTGGFNRNQLFLSVVLNLGPLQVFLQVGGEDMNLMDCHFVLDEHGTPN